MSGIVLCLNEVENTQNGQPVVCPYCACSTVRRWGSGTRNIYDTRPINAVVFRYYCVECNRTFRYYPQGVDRAQISVRIRRLAALLWLMEVSTRDVEEIFENLGVSINRMTVWREGQKLIDELTHQKLLNLESRYTLIRAASDQGADLPTLTFSICLDSCKIAVLGKMSSNDGKQVKTWLQAVLAENEIEILDLSDFDFSSAELLYLPL